MINYKQIWAGLRLKQKATLNSDTNGEMETSSVTNKTYLHNGTTRSPIVTADHTETLVNKAIDADNNTISELEVDNLKAGVLNTSTTLAGASDLQVPSALAVKTYVDDTFSPQTDVADLVTLTGVPANSTDLGTFTGTTIPDDQTIKEALQSLETGLEAHISDAVDAHDASAISSIPSGNLSATDVQSALDELQTDIDTRALDTALQAHINDTVDAHDASAISVTPFPGIVSTDVQSALVELEAQIVAGGTGDVSGPASSTDNAIARFDSTTGKIIQNSVVTVSDTGVIAGSSIDADTNTITNIENADIKTGAAIDRSKLASGTANAVVHNDGSGVMSNSADLLVGTNALTLANTKHLELQAATDSTTTGAAASLTAFTAGGVRLTNASLVSIANIPAGTNGQELLIFNRTGADVTVSDSSAALGTAANRILTGTNGTITFTNNAALLLSYDSTTQRWQIVGGTGSGTGSSASLDTILQLTASEQLTDWSTGDNATFLGGGTLAGTFVKETTTPLHGTASYKYTQAAGSLDDYLASAVFPVDLRFRGQQVYFSAPIQYNGNTGDIQIVIYDVTNSTVLTTLSNSIIATNGATQTVIASALLPLTCVNIRVGFQVKVLNSGKVFSFDDVQVEASLSTFTSIDTQVTQAIEALTPTTTFGSTNTGVPVLNITKNTNNGVIRVDSSAAAGTSFVALKACTLNITANTVSTTSAAIYLTKNSTILTTGTPTGDFSISGLGATNGSFNASGSITLNVGDVVRVQRNGAGITNICYVTLTATASSDSIVTPTQQISSDTLPFTYANAATYTLSTLTNAPLGTYLTFTYAINSNARVQTTGVARPTQTDADMNINGIQLFTRAYNAASTSGNPAAIAIQVGKGLKAHQLNLYKSTGRTTAGNLDLMQDGTTIQYGATFKDYNESTGILIIDCGYTTSASITSHQALFSDGTTQNNGYVTFNASTTPSITALPILQPRIAYLSDVKASGTAGGSSVVGVQTRTLNTIADPTGIVTSLTSNQFTLPRGVYYIEASAPALTVGSHKARLRNITDGTTSLIGSSCFSSSVSDYALTISIISGEVLINSPKVFEIQHYIQVAKASTGLGTNASSGESEVYSICKITKIRDL